MCNSLGLTFLNIALVNLAQSIRALDAMDGRFTRHTHGMGGCYLFCGLLWAQILAFATFENNYDAARWCYWWQTTVFYVMAMMSTGKLSHAAKESVTLRAIPMLLIRIACLANFIMTTSQYIYYSYLWFNIWTDGFAGYTTIYMWIWIFYISSMTCMNMLPMVALAWIALRPPVMPHHDEHHAEPGA